MSNESIKQKNPQLNTYQTTAQSASRFFMGSTKPLVLTEGETDVEYIKTALALLGHYDLLDRVDIEWVGTYRQGNASYAGVPGLNNVKKHYEANPGLLTRRLLLLYDCDARKDGDDSGLLSVRTIPFNDQNSLVQKGIENIFPEHLFEPLFFKQKEIIGTDGRTRVKQEFLKTDFVRVICRERRQRDDFAGFESIAAIIRKFIGPYSDSPKGEPLIIEFDFDDEDRYPEWFLEECDFWAGSTVEGELVVSDPNAAKAFGKVEFSKNIQGPWTDITEARLPLKLAKDRRYIFYVRAVPSDESKSIRQRPDFTVGLIPLGASQSLLDSKSIQEVQNASLVAGRLERAAYTLYTDGRFPGFHPQMAAIATTVPGTNDNVNYHPQQRQHECILARYDGQFGKWECYVRPDNLMPIGNPKRLR